jgi:hypothetical protein
MTGDLAAQERDYRKLWLFHSMNDKTIVSDADDMSKKFFP